jgi:hypothetical protein
MPTRKKTTTTTTTTTTNPDGGAAMAYALEKMRALQDAATRVRGMDSHAGHASSPYTHQHLLAHCADCNVIYCQGCSMQWGSVVSHVVDHSVPRTTMTPSGPYPSVNPGYPGYSGTALPFGGGFQMLPMSAGTINIPRYNSIR